MQYERQGKCCAKNKTQQRDSPQAGSDMSSGGAKSAGQRCQSRPCISPAGGPRHCKAPETASLHQQRHNCTHTPGRWAAPCAGCAATLLPATGSGPELPDCHGVCGCAGRKPRQAPVDVADAHLVGTHAAQHVPTGEAIQVGGDQLRGLGWASSTAARWERLSRLPTRCGWLCLPSTTMPRAAHSRRQRTARATFCLSCRLERIGIWVPHLTVASGPSP